MSLSKKAWNTREIALGPQVIATQLYGDEAAGSGQALVDDSIFWVCPDYLGLRWRIVAIECVYDVPASGSAQVEISKTMRNGPSGPVLKLFEVGTGGPGSQQAASADLSAKTEENLTMRVGSKLTYRTYGTVDDLRGCCVIVIVVPETAVWMRYHAA